MPQIHPTTIISDDVTLADDVVIGPYCVLEGPITIGARSRLIGNVYVQGPLTLGEDNLVYPFACLGFAPQSVAYDPQKPGEGTVIGDGSVFREHATVHRAMTDEGPTRVGDANYFMAGSHVGHDGQVGNHCIFANGTAVGGHAVIDDRVNVGGGTMIHQFVRVGRGCMLSGNVGLTMNLPPHFMLTSINCAGSLNIVGLRRSGATPQDIDDVRWVFRLLYRKRLTVANALEVMRERADHPKVAEYIEFIEASDGRICPGHLKTGRGGPAAVKAETA